MADKDRSIPCHVHLTLETADPGHHRAHIRCAYVIETLVPVEQKPIGQTSVPRKDATWLAGGVALTSWRQGQSVIPHRQVARSTLATPNGYLPDRHLRDPK